MGIGRYPFQYLKIMAYADFYRVASRQETVIVATATAYAVSTAVKGHPGHNYDLHP